MHANLLCRVPHACQACGRTSMHVRGAVLVFFCLYTDVQFLLFPYLWVAMHCSDELAMFMLVDTPLETDNTHKSGSDDLSSLQDQNVSGTMKGCPLL